MGRKTVGKAVRRIIQVGECSGIILPKEYLTANKLKRGDRVEIVYNSIVRIEPLRDEDIRRKLAEAPA